MIPVNQHIHLSAPVAADSAAICEWMQDVEISENTSLIPYPHQQSDADTWLKLNRDFEIANGFNRNYAIRNSEGKLIGSIGLHFNYGLNEKRSEIGYWLANEYRNRGIMTEVLRIFEKTVKQKHGLTLLEAHVFAFNLASQKALLNAGYTRQPGILEKHYIKKGRELDAVRFYKEL